MRQIVVAALLATVLAACSDNPTKEAAIEDRGVKAVPVSAQQAKAEAAKAEAAKVEAAKVEAAKAEAAAKEAAAATAAKQAAEKSETRAVSQTAIETKPLEGVKVDAKAAGATAKPVLDPKDPKSPLAQRRIQFDYDSAAIRDEFRPMLEAHAQYLKEGKQVKVVLQGHTDERGSPEYNIALGQRRAEAVLKALSLLGVPETQMEAVSFGEEKPVNEGHDEAAWGQNRRAEIAYPNE